MIRPRVWRIGGGVCIAASAAMAWYGAIAMKDGWQPWFLLVYWSLFLVFFVGAVYCAILDIRHIRVQFLQSERDLFMSTLGSEEFRRSLREAQQREHPKRDE